MSLQYLLLCVQHTSVHDKKQIDVLYLSTIFSEIFQDTGFQTLPSIFHKLIYISSKTRSPQLLHFDVLQCSLKMDSFYFFKEIFAIQMRTKLQSDTRKQKRYLDQ